MKQKSRVTIKELSKLMGVSATTITNALTGQPNVSKNKRDEIIQKAEKLGYKPNMHARAMVKNGIKIGVVWAEEPHEFNDYLRIGFNNAVETYSDYKVSISDYHFHDLRATNEVRDALSSVLSDGIDGLILHQSFYTDTYFDMLKDYVIKHDLPVVYYYHEIKEIPSIATVCTNSEVIGKTVAQLLGLILGEGSTVGVITTTKLYNPHRRTVAEFIRQCESVGLKIAEIMENEDNKTKTYNCTYALLKKYPEIKAIYITSFDTVTVCKCVENMGLKDKVWVVGHDIYPEMVKYLENGPILATVFQNPILTGRIGFDLLLNYILGNRVKQGEMIIHPELVLKSNLECYKEYM